MMNPMETVLQFLERINRHDSDKLAEWMTEDHLLIDSVCARPPKDAHGLARLLFVLSGLLGLA